MSLAYVRTTDFTVSSINVLFNDDIDTNVGVNNVVITSELGNVSDPEIKSVGVENDVVTVHFSAMFPNVQYKVTFRNTDTQNFQTVNGEAIFEDGNRNSFFVTSPGEEENQIRDDMFEAVSTLYETHEPTLVRDLISSTANEFNKASESIETTKSANYLSELITDEIIVRDDGPIDRLGKGGAFEIIRVATVPTGSTKSTYLEYSATREQTFKPRDGVVVNSVIESLTVDPISLQSVDKINEKVTDDVQESNYFNGLSIRVANGPIIQVISVSLLRDGEYTEYEIEQFGYTLQDNRYDEAAASINVNLTDRDVELSSSSITGATDGFLLPRAGDEIYISYVYKRLGRDVGPDSVAVSRLQNQVREVVPAVINIFTLDHAPIVTSLDEVATLNAVEFLNTSSSGGRQAFTTIHPAFDNEIPYDITKFPAVVGEYAVNYNTGEVVVFGDDDTNSGTGENSPVANYMYRETFIKDLDYTFNSDRDEIAINSTRSLEGITAKVSFDYEDTFAAGTDFRVLSHVETLNERVNNRLTSSFKIQTANFPVTDVFRILNETTGELYTLDRFNDTTVSFTGRQQPRQRDIERERAQFSRVPQEVLLVSDELTNSYALRIFKIELANNGLSDSQARYVGANFDTSVLFSDTDVFLREFFYEDRLFQNVDTNLDRLEIVGDYLINYVDGIVYVAISSAQGTDIGDVTYQHKKIETVNKHILGVNDIYRSRSALQSNVKIYSIGATTDTTVNITGLEQVGERFINNDSKRPIIVGSYQNGEDGITVKDDDIFVSNGGTFTSADIGRTLLVGSSGQPPVQDVVITSIINEHEVTVDAAFTYSKSGRVWSIFDITTGSAKTITLDYDIVAVKDIYLVNQLGSLPAGEPDGYFDINRDSVSGNVITLGSSNPLSVGDAVVVNYNPGDIMVDYRHLRDELIISYEYGNNALDWSVGDALLTNDEYYVTYRYGALRNSLLMNFGSLTQIEQLTNFDPNLNREVYRDVLSGTLQSFIEGPTIPSLERLVEAFTDVTPNISEAAFNNWVLGRDNLHLRKMKYNASQTFDLGKYDNGVVIQDDQNIEVPALAHFPLREGTMEMWVRPQWKGLANDASITFTDLAIDGYNDPSRVFIGFAGSSPAKFPFTLNVEDTDITVTGEPSNLNDDTGYFIWFDEFDDLWHLRWRERPTETIEFNGLMSTTGEFFNVVRPLGSDGYEIDEITDVITSTTTGIEFVAFIDGYDAASTTSLFAMDGVSFSAGNSHYIFDMAKAPATNRISLFKDGTGYLNFQIFDHMAKFGLPAGLYNLSHNIRDWNPNSLHHIAVSWKLNDTEEMDEMHLFVDGAEVPSLFKYGGNPKSSSSFDFGDVAEETIIGTSARPILGAFDGSTTSGSTLFMSESADFQAAGVQVGDSFYLQDDTTDGTGDPNFGLAYAVTGVGTTTLTLDRAPTLTLGYLHYSLNSATKTVTTQVNIQDFVVVTMDADGNETELYGVDSDYPDYSIRRGGNQTHVITINNRVALYDTVFIRPLGLLLKRCRERVYVYDGGYDEVRINAAQPVTLGDVKITAVVLDRTLISTGGGFGLVGTIIGAQLVTMLQSYFNDVCQPSNSSAGRKLAVKLSGDNFNYNIAGNQVIIAGETYSGAVKETILFTDSSTIVTDEYWQRIDSITVSVIPIDAGQPVGTVEVSEYMPITISENNGDFAEVVEYSNGIFRLETYGTGGQPFILNGCTYDVDYPSYLRIRVDELPDTFFIGSEYTKGKRFDGVIDEFRILNQTSEDTRAGETLLSGERSITTDYNSSTAFRINNNTLFLAHFDNSTEDASTFRDRYVKGFDVSESVNTDFGMAIKFAEDKPYIIGNAGAIFNADEGSAELWLSPLDDSRGDPNYHYYIDMSAVVEEELESVSSLAVITSQRVREIKSIRLLTDIYNTGTDYYTGGSVSNVDRKTVTLGIPLPTQNVMLKVVYVPLNNQGDRVSLFRDPYGRINFFVKATGVEHMITVPMSWTQHTWHRIMLMWKMNSVENEDRLRLFVDGSERGTIRYGTGLIYGTGVIYGQAEVRPGVNRFLVDNIDLTDTFAQIYIGSDTNGLNGARALMDNIRFSEIQRLNSIKVTSNDTVDINYMANVAFATPVVEDVHTSAIYDFDTTESDIDFLATVVNAERGIFRFKVEVIDSFDKVIGNTDLEELLAELINIIKPAHTESIILFEE